MNDKISSAQAVELTENAGRQIAKILSREPDGTVLRIAVSGGGCSGFQYEYNLVADERQSDDLVLTRAGGTVLIDNISLQFLEGAKIDYVDDLVGQAFKITNPNTVASCGCGNSFDVA